MKKIIIFPIKSATTSEENIYFAKAFTLFLYLSLDSVFISSNIISLITEDKKLISEELYINYPHQKLIEQLRKGESDYSIYGEFNKIKNRFVFSLSIYDELKNSVFEKDYIFNENLFEEIYKKIVRDIFGVIGRNFLLREVFLYEKNIFYDIVNIIKLDGTFFNVKNEVTYIKELRYLFLKHNNFTIFRYIIKKIIQIDNYFLVYEVMEELKNDIAENDYMKFLMANTLKFYKRYDEAVNILESMDTSSIFYKLKETSLNTLKAECYLRMNNLKKARHYISKAVKLRSDSLENTELFLEIMFKSEFFLAFKSYLEENTSLKTLYVVHLGVRYYTDIKKEYLKALKYSEIYKYEPLIVFWYLKSFFHITGISNDLKKYIYDLYGSGILDYEESEENKLFNVKLFLKVFLLYEQKNNILNLNFKKIPKITPFDDISLSVKEKEKIVFNYIYNNLDKDKSEIEGLLYFLLEDYRKAFETIRENRELYYYANALIHPLKTEKFLKKAFRINKSMYVLNTLIEYYYSQNKYFRFKHYLKLRKKYYQNDDFSVFYTAKLFFLKKNYKAAIEILDKSGNSGNEFKFFKAELYFHSKDYEEMFKLDIDKEEIMKDGKLSYMFGLALLNLRNDRKGLFYLQNSYNLNPNKILKKRLIKEYKRYGIEYRHT